MFPDVRRPTLYSRPMSTDRPIDPVSDKKIQCAETKSNILEHNRNVHAEVFGFNCRLLYLRSRAKMSVCDEDEVLADVLISRSTAAYLYAVDCPLASDWSNCREEMHLHWLTEKKIQKFWTCAKKPKTCAQVIGCEKY